MFSRRSASAPSIPADVPAYWAAKTTTYDRLYVCPATGGMFGSDTVTPATNGGGVGKITDFSNAKHILAAGMASPAAQAVNSLLSSHWTADRMGASSYAFDPTGGYGLILLGKIAAGSSGYLLHVNDGDLNLPEMQITGGNIQCQVTEEDTLSVPTYTDGYTIIGLFAAPDLSEFILITNGIEDSVVTAGEINLTTWSQIFVMSTTSGTGIQTEFNKVLLGIESGMSEATWRAEIAEARLHWTSALGQTVT